MQSIRSLHAFFRPCLIAINGNIRVRYVRGERKFPGRLSLNRLSEEDNVIQQLEEMEDALSSYDQSKEDLQRMEKEERQNLKKIILKKKMFKKPQEIQLLTWAAKEQIRFLNSEYPEEWPVDRLAESFPISREGVIRLLKSSYVPRNDAEIIRHDQKVHKHWQMLKKLGMKNNDDGGPIDPALNYLLESKKIKLLLHAGGHQNLPMPSQLRTQVKLAGLLDNKTIKPGPFSKILMSYEQKVSEKSKSTFDKKTKNIKQTTALPNVQDNRKLLEAVIETFNYTTDTLSVPETVSKNRTEQVVLPSSPGNQNLDEEESTKTALSRRERRLLKQNETGLNINIKNIQKLQMMDTHKVVHAKVPSEDDNSEEIERKQAENSELFDETFDENPHFIYSRNKEKLETLDTLPIRYEEMDNEIRDGEKLHQAYLYDDRHGYQYPLGVIDESLQSIEVPKEKKEKFYRKGDIVYDENGQFLYRIP